MGGMQQAPGVRELPVGIAFGPLDRLDLPARLKTPDEGPRLGPREFILDGELTTKAIGAFAPLGIILRRLRAPANGSHRSARPARHLPRGPVRHTEDRSGRCNPRAIPRKHSEARSCGKEGVSACRARGSTYH